MGDPDLRGDESVILRTQGIFVKSIPFEGFLTNKRIILVDKAKNLLPQKEIPLVMIKDINVGENAIRDQIITLSIVARSGEMRQMILTFSRQTGGNRIRERDAWAKALKENISSSFEQVIRKVIPGRGPAPKKPERAVSPRIEVISPEPDNLSTLMKKTAKKEIKLPPARTPETSRSLSPSTAAGKVSDIPVPVLGTFCSRCGNRVPEGSGFCNRCGSPIVVPGTNSAYAGADEKLQLSRPETVTGIHSASTDELPEEPRTDLVAGSTQPPLPEGAPEPETPDEPEIQVPLRVPADIPELDLIYSEFNEEPGPEPPLVLPSSVPEPGPPAKKPPAPWDIRGLAGIMPGRRTVYAGVLLLSVIVVIAGVFFVYSQLSMGGAVVPNATTSPTPLATTPGSSGTISPRVTTEVTVPPEGVFVHVMYLGGWKGSYGILPDLKTLTSSGDRYFAVENATGIVEASFEKLDGSTRQTLGVEILRNGRILTSGNTTAGFGKITLSVDTATGIAKPPLVSTGGVP